MSTGRHPPRGAGHPMRERLRTRLAYGLVGLFAITTGGCGTTRDNSDPAVKTVTPGVLTVATYGTVPLSVEVGPGLNELHGYSGEWINAYARDHDLTVKVLRMTFSAALFAVRSGTADLSPDVFYNADRARYVYYTYPVGITTLHAFTMARFPWSGTRSLIGHRVGAISGYAWVPYFSRAFGNHLNLYTTPEDAKTALLDGRIDAYLDQNIQYFGPPFSQNPRVTTHALRPGDLGIPAFLISVPAYLIVNCDEKVLANGLNDTMRRLQSSGAWAAILKRLNTAPTMVTLQPAPLRAPTNFC